MEYIEIVVGFVVACIAGWFLIPWSIRRDRQKLLARKVTPIGELRAGAKARIVGTVEPIDGDQTKAVVWQGAAVIHAALGSSAETPMITNPFRIRDATGDIAIVVEHVVVRAGSQVISDSPAKRLAERQPGVLSGASIEYRIMPGDRVSAEGTVRQDGARLILAGSETEPLVLADP